MRICVAGAYGAFGMKHLDALDAIEGVTVTSIMGPTQAKIEALAAERGIGHSSTNLDECISRDDVDAVILATPTQLHAEQAVACMKAGKPVFIEIPMSDSLEDARRICEVQKETGVLAMAGQVRRYNPSHQWIKNKIRAGELKIQQMDVQTYFFRRSNMNAKGEPRSWTDHRPVPVPDRRSCHRSVWHPRPSASGSRDCYGYDHRDEGPVGRDLYLVTIV